MTKPDIHPIRLKGPWEILQRPGDSRAATEATSTTLPFDWRALFGDAGGTAVFGRRFNRPTGLTPDHRVRIVLRDVIVLRQVAVNDHPLTIEHRTDGSHAVDITQHLQPHNRLTIELQFHPDAEPHRRGGISQPVTLEIEEPAEGSR